MPRSTSMQQRMLPRRFPTPQHPIQSAPPARRNARRRRRRHPRNQLPMMTMRSSASRRRRTDMKQLLAIIFIVMWTATAVAQQKPDVSALEASGNKHYELAEYDAAIADFKE